MPISSALLEAVQIEYYRDFLDGSRVQNEEFVITSDEPVNEPQLEILEPNSDGEYAPPEIIVAECLIQLAWSGEEDPKSEHSSSEYSSETSCSCIAIGDSDETVDAQEYEYQRSSELVAFFRHASATSTPLKKTYEEEFQPYSKRRLIF